MPKTMGFIIMNTVKTSEILSVFQNDAMPQCSIPNKEIFEKYILKVDDDLKHCYK